MGNVCCCWPRSLVLYRCLRPVPPFIRTPPSRARASRGWHTFGPAEWRAENGELVATPKQGAGGWLVLDHSYQDIGVYTQFRCTGGCETGVLLRAEKTPTGMKGIYVALSDPDLPTYSVTIDAQGQIVERNKLRRGGGLERIAPPPSPEARARISPASLHRDAAFYPAG